VIVQLSDDAEIDLLVAIAFYEKHGTHVDDLFLVSISKDIGKNSGTVPGFFQEPRVLQRPAPLLVPSSRTQKCTMW
jgi:hypothetical protein